jgi:hypothetical protein
MILKYFSLAINIVDIGVGIICFSFVLLIIAVVQWRRHISDYNKK